MTHYFHFYTDDSRSCAGVNVFESGTLLANTELYFKGEIVNGFIWVIYNRILIVTF